MGRLTVLSALGQPLRAEIEVSAAKEELPGMVARLAHPDAYRAAGIEYGSALGLVRLVLDKAPDGKVFIKVSTERPVSDPFLDVLIELSWSAGRLVREYTFLLDPPEVVREAPPPPAPIAQAPAPVAERVAEPVKSEPASVQEPEAAKPAPAAAKADKAPVTARAAEGDGTSREVKYGDTLGKIAKEFKPEGVTLDQMLVGLFRANPDAFSGKNMNRLKAGKILVVPGKDEIDATASPDARKEVLAQATDWNAYRRKLAGVAAQAPAADTAAPKESAGKITAKVEDKAPAKTDGKDQVKVSKTETPATAPPAAAAAAKKPAEEDKVAKERALKESADRAKQLEKNVADLQKLVEMKNQSMAQAQAQAKPAVPAPAAPAAAKPAEPAPPVASPAPAAAPPVQPPKAMDPAKPAEAPKADATPAEAPKPKPKVVIPPPPEEEENLLENPAVWGGLLALLGGIGGLVYYRRKKNEKSSESSLSAPSLGEPSLGANSVFRATGGQSVDTSAATPAVTDFSQTGPGTIDTDEVDPVAEAEVYMAYGRDAQAEEILLEALQKDSKRLSIHVKLLEIYAQRKSTKQFETLATELYAQTGGAGPEWEKAVAMGSKLDPANPLYSGGTASAGGAQAAGFDSGSTVVLTPAAIAAATTVVLPGGIGQAAESAASGRSAVNEVASLADSLGIQGSQGDNAFGFNLGGSTGSSPFGAGSTTRLEEPVAPAAIDLGAPLSVDISFDLPAAPAAETGSAIDSGMALDFDLGVGSQTDISAGMGKAGGGLDFDLGLSASRFDTGVAGEPANKPDMSAINLDLGAPADAGMNFEQTLFVNPGAAAELMAGVDAGKAQEVATKLDLAKAYEEMGDAEGARELLNEVAAEGSAQQRSAAAAMLKRLG